MKKTLLALAIIASSTSIAYAETKDSNYYIGGQIGASIQKATDTTNEYMDGTGLSGAVNLGYNFQPNNNIPVRAELSYTYRSDYKKTSSTEISSSTVSTGMNSLMLNGYYDFHTNSSFTPYVTVGVGFGFDSLSSKYSYSYTSNGNTISGSGSMSKSSNPFAWNVGAGVAYDINSNWIADFSAKYVRTGALSSDGTTYWDNMNSVDLMFGVRYSF